MPLTAEQVAAPDADAYLAAFEQEYRALFARSVEGLEVEITVWSVNAATPPHPVTPVTGSSDAGLVEPVGRRTLFEPAESRTVEAAVCERADFVAGSRVDGPALITEDETTVVLPVSRHAAMLADGTIDMCRKEA